jgi:hypothetical protein
MKLKSPHLVRPGSHVRLNKFSTNSTGRLENQEAAAAVLVSHRDQLTKLQEVLYASQQ